MFSFNKPKSLLWSLFIIVLTSVINISAATLIVTTLTDTDDTVCDSHCSLREALSAALPSDTIIFASDLRGGTIQLTKTLTIEKRITIDGPNKRRITLKGNNTFRIIEIRGNTSSMVVSIDGLIIRDGYEISGDGGGIYVNPVSSATLNLTNIAILNNTALRGGGIYQSFGRIFLIDCTVANNTATGTQTAGGLDLQRSVDTRIMNSTISGNVLSGMDDGAGGIRLTGATWFINGSTIAFNVSNGTSSFSAGGVVALNGNPGPISNSILAKNNGLNPDFYGRAGVLRYSLVGISDKRSGFINGENGNFVGTIKAPIDPQLGLLNDNGGGLSTHALLPASQAIDTGSNNLSIDGHGDPLAIDQRGFARIINFIVDIGSFENNSQSVTTTSKITGQVTNTNGRPISKALIFLRTREGTTFVSITNPFGYYHFANVITDVTYTINCIAKNYTFQQQNFLIEEPLETINLQANERFRDK